MRRIVVVGGLALVLGACAAPQPWSKPGVTAQFYEQDVRDCDQQAERQGRLAGAPGHKPQPAPGVRTGAGSEGMAAVQHHSEHQRFFAACMTERGYTRQ